MKNAKTFLALSCVLFALAGCSSTSSVSSSSEKIESSEEIEGGEHGMVVGQYWFDTFEEYGGFYEIFKAHNPERYWVPADSASFDILYVFKTVPISLDDLRAKRYDLTFKGQEMTAELKYGSCEANLRFEEISYLSTNLEKAELSSAFEEKEEDTYSVSFSCNHAEVASGSLLFPDGDSEKVSALLEELTDLFVEGKFSVF